MRILSLIAVLVIPMILFAGVYVRDTCLDWAFLSTHPLIAGLPREKQQAFVALKTRILKRYPIGCQASELGKYLVSEGFRVGVDSRNRDVHVARVTKLGNIADLKRQDRFFDWKIDHDGKVTSIESSYSITIS